MFFDACLRALSSEQRERFLVSVPKTLDVPCASLGTFFLAGDFFFSRPKLWRDKTCGSKISTQ